ncbi:MAG: hypothetical protein U1C46_05390, partial [Bacteroidales bacterium]|nr:hypothetical protein [Bacteroidales bacterium]
SNVEYVEITFTDENGTYTEKFPTKANVEHKINSAIKLTASFEASYSEKGMPTSITLNIVMLPYNMTLSFSGSGVNFSTSLLIKKESNVLISSDLNITYTSDKATAENISGHFQVTPLRIEGSAKPFAMDNCGETDISCLNKNTDIKVKQSELKKTIGHIEFKMVYDPDLGEEVLQPVLVYEDGSWELVEDIMGSL